MTDTSPDHFSRFRVVRQVGEGGMGVVYEAVDAKIGRRVAIKRLDPALAVRTDVVRRFLNEARVVNLISHPAIVQVYEADFAADGSAYLVMEFLDGETLAARLQRCGGSLPIEQSVWILWQLASALQAAHAHGVVHRDLKPSNVMLVPDPAMPGAERIKLLDFGIAKLSSASADGERGPLTRTGMMMGTPVYMSPEQCLGGTQVDGKADVYALGVMAFEMMVGRPPFMAAQDLVLLQLHVTERPPPLRDLNPAVPRGLSRLVAAMLSKNPQERPNIAQLTGEIRKWMSALPFSGMQSPPRSDGAGPPMLGQRSHVTTLRQLTGQLTVSQQRSVLVAIGVAAALLLGGTFGAIQWLRHGSRSAHRPHQGGHAENGLGSPAPAATTGAPGTGEVSLQDLPPKPAGANPTSAPGASASGAAEGTFVPPVAPSGDREPASHSEGQPAGELGAKKKGRPEKEAAAPTNPDGQEPNEVEPEPSARPKVRERDAGNYAGPSHGGRKKGGGGRSKKGGGRSAGDSTRSSVSRSPARNDRVPRIAD